MTTLPKFSEQYDKIIRAYFKDDIKPYHAGFCFCGTIGINIELSGIDRLVWSNDWYSNEEYNEMEYLLLSTIRNYTIGKSACSIYGRNNSEDSEYLYSSRESIKSHENYENALFEGMSSALDALKKIHISKGEIIEETPVFEKRVLQPA